MPPVGQIAKGVFVVAPGKVETYKDTVAGGYVSAFTKARADQWELSLKEAAANVKNAEDRYQLELRAYQERLRDLEKQKAEALLVAEKYNADAINAAREQKQKSDFDVAQANAKLKLQAEAASKKLVYPNFGGTKITTVTGKPVAGAPKTPEQEAATTKLSQSDEDELGDAVSQGGTGAAIESLKGKLASGTMVGSTPAKAMAVRTGLIDKLAGQRASQKGISLADATAEIVSEASDIDPGLVADYNAVKSAATSLGAPTGEVTTKVEDVSLRLARAASGRVRAPTIELKGVETAPQLMNQKAIAAQYDQLIGDLSKRFPQAEPTDLIYSARRLMQRNFGPTRGAAESAFDQRRVLDTLLRATPAQREGLLQRFRQSGPTSVSTGGPSVAPVEPATVSPPPAAPAGRDVSPDVTAGQPPASPSIADILAGFGPAQPTGVTRTPATPAPDVAFTQTPADEFVAETPDEMRARAQRAQLRSLASSVDEEGEVSPPAADQFGGVKMIRPQDVMQGAPSTTIVRPEVEAKLAEIDRLISAGRSARQEEITANRPTQLTRSEIASLKSRSSAAAQENLAGTPDEGGLDVELALRPFRPTESPVEQERAKQVKYTIDRTSDAKELLSQPNKLGRLMRSPVGKAVKQVWTTSKDFRQAFDEITLLYANKPKDRESAHAILFAIELSAKKSTDIPKAGE